ncbi:carbamoyltransferase HypF [Rhodoblastus sphagnicola]|uniref:Carbamoyltransferase HypF n=1 Tax=Rhodoblastus sphagnicola TaxID=333368 RepID=A0A2S6N593_9HYPH|nr:carbamoyltransferase HypF [Rhodoblastus sphagnicola]MBB4197161.1 hydrogenase maturation protein HypF [Rhodoblastus sphagnicola]PPQ29776.1 carbamoyltransferase HypF [Rhodoblastus sphagnicola]
MTQPARQREQQPTRLHLRLRGAVQGVGMRPFVHGLAARFSLSGFVRNDSEGVLIEVEGFTQDFVAALHAELPPLARLDSCECEEIFPRGDTGFVIETTRQGRAQTRIPADAATCEKCLDDLFDPSSRFHLYPFVNCTHCGPRYTLTRALPYDRAQTAMARFPMCEDCANDYADPTNRRFHAEPIACEKCGPRLSHQPQDIVAALRAGKIVALKGIGGFHLLCDARNADTVLELRRRKDREAKPFALMLANAASVALFGRPTPAELALLRAPAHPIVLIDSSRNLPDTVAPDMTRLGVMLAYAPVHHLLFRAAGAQRNAPCAFAVVATSANPGGEPLITDNDEAQRKLEKIADLIVTHDRDIVVRADDSVMHIVDGAPAFLRRARGFVPEPIDLGEDGPSVLACGGHLKATLTLTRGREAFVCQHIGDLSDAETFRFYEESATHLLRLLDIAPEAVACDLHPDYLSTRFAEDFGAPVLRFQHHAAHIAAIGAEHGETQILGAALDGTGLGADGAVWGGEVLRLDGHGGFTREGSLSALPLWGGDRAAREPFRMGVAAFAALGRLDEASAFFSAVPQAAQAAKMLGAKHPQTSSLGRLFDAAAALLGYPERQEFEGQAAMRLEALAREPRVLAGGFVWRDGKLDFTPLLAHFIDARPDARAGAELLHGTVIAGFSEALCALTQSGEKIALGGGCMMNRILSEGLAARLREENRAPLLARKLPPNDGGLSLGQAALARAVLMKV